MIWTDGVFSMEGSIAKLPDILELARDYDAIVVIDDSHATGVLGKTGRGTAEHFGVVGDVDVITSTLGKALGGAAGGFVAGSAALCDYLTQREPERVERLRENARYFREQITEAGFRPLAGETPIVPIIIGETADAIRLSDALLDEGVFVTGFGYPVVPQGQARVRCQISAAHSRADIDTAIDAFKKVGRRLKLI
jgi:glycine C-acetyltransferase